jgi:hypothetical protein
VVERHLQDAVADGLLSRGTGSGLVTVDSGNERLVLQAERAS